MALDDHYDASRLAGHITRAPRLPVAGFWVRLIAFVVDGILLTFLFYALAFVAREPLLALGPWATVLAGLMIVAYFTLGDGPVGKGRTVGKVLMGLRTVSAPDGAPLQPKAAFIRAFLLIPPYFWFTAFVLPFAALQFDSPSREFFFLQLPRNLTLALILGQIVHVAFNPTRQGIHDTAAGSLVLGIDHLDVTWGRLLEEAGPVGIERTRRARQAGWICFAVFVLFLGFIGGQEIKERKKAGVYETASRLREKFSEFGIDMMGGGQRRLPVQEAPANGAAPAGQTAEAAAATAQTPQSRTPGAKTGAGTEAERTGPRAPGAEAAAAAADDEPTTPLGLAAPHEYEFHLFHRGDDPRPPAEIRADLEILADWLMDFFREQAAAEERRVRDEALKKGADTRPPSITVPKGSLFVFVYDEYLDLVLHQTTNRVVEVERTF